MTTVQNVGVVPPLPHVGEGRSSLSPVGQRPSTQGSTADQVRSQAAESARAAEAVRAQSSAAATKDVVKVETRQLATKAGLIQGTFDAFVDVVDPRYQTRIARIFGPDSAPAAADAAPNLVPKVVSKAYEAIEGSSTSGAFRQSA